MTADEIAVAEAEAAQDAEVLAWFDERLAEAQEAQGDCE